jgi:hypothetical protein
MLSDSDIARFKRDGFFLLKRVFSDAEISHFRSAGAPLSEISNNLIAVRGLESLWCDSRLVAIARQLLGERITFFSEATYARYLFQPGERIQGRHIHHDAKGTVEHPFNRQHLPTPEPYPIIRFAIYLQDHAGQSGGLKIVPGSHQIDSSDIDELKLNYFNVPTEPGDLVLFCNKLLHSPFALRPKADPERALSPLQEIQLSHEQPDMFLPAPFERNTIFIDFAGHNELADIYIKGRALHPKNIRSGVAESFQVGPLKSDAERTGVTLRLDSGVTEALSMIVATARDGQMTREGAPYLNALPDLCRASKAWSPHYNFIPAVEDGMSPLDLYRQIAARAKEVRKLWNTVLIDKAMVSYELAKLSG